MCKPLRKFDIIIITSLASMKFTFNITIFTFLRSIFRGESAFHAMMQGFGWAKNPIVKRIDQLDSKIPITLLYGSRSWVDNSAGERIKQVRSSSYVNVQVMFFL